MLERSDSNAIDMPAKPAARRHTLALVILAGCGGGGGGGIDADPATIDASPSSIRFRSPADGATVLGSAVADLDAGTSIEAVEVYVTGEAAPRCTLVARPFTCLVDTTAIAPGAFALSARGLVGGSEVATATVAASRRAYATEACAAGAPADCVAALVGAGQAAGYAGLSYHDMDNGHAVADTSAMTGIEAQVNQAYAGTDPWHTDPARIVVANQSQAYNFPDGWMSIPRNGSIANIGTLWAESKLFLWPEHRDHGIVDYYAWQTPTLVLSQGSSGSELDEVAKLLHILAALPADTRAELHADHALMAAVVMLHRRARVATDVDYVTAAAHAPAVVDADVGREGVQLAASIRRDETPPLAQLTVESATIPPDWASLGFVQPEMGPTTIVWSANAVPPAPPTTTFTAIVDLAASADRNGRSLYFFARVVRGDPARVRVTQLDASRFQLDAEWPAEVAEMVNGQSRSTRRATVAFFAHNGLWLSAPVFASIFGGNPAEHAPDSNNLD
jgi:hypothetical protein